VRELTLKLEATALGLAHGSCVRHFEASRWLCSHSAPAPNSSRALVMGGRKGEVGEGVGR
jgi:hypothetical protein